MAKALIRERKHSSGRTGEAGFSMIEMLMTAFILAIGLLGLCMLQTMSLRASRGGTSLTTAVHVADAVMEQVEQEGRISWQNMALGYTTALPNLEYISLAVGGKVTQTFNLHGDVSLATSTDPTVSSALFTVTTTRLDDAGLSAGTGQVSDYLVQVQFAENTSGAGTAVQRTVMVTRRIIHG
jgi:prepilin-type N-terminal cleavage/methylation domain-containing protein